MKETYLGIPTFEASDKRILKKKNERENSSQFFCASSRNTDGLQNLQVPYAVSNGFELNLTIGKIIQIRTHATLLLYEVWNKEYLKKYSNLSK